MSYDPPEPSYSVESLVFGAWCDLALPYPRRVAVQDAACDGMLEAVSLLTPEELVDWIRHRAELIQKLGRAFVPDARLEQMHYYERAIQRLRANAQQHRAERLAERPTEQPS